MFYKEGQSVKLYDDWENQCGPSEDGELIQYVSDGLPFILKEAEKEEIQEIFSSELWVVKTQTGIKRARFRKLFHIGIPTSTYLGRKKEFSDLLEDRFLSIFGIEIY